MKITLYHQISDPGSAAVRKLLFEMGLSDSVQYRNIQASEAAAQDFQSMGFQKTPVMILDGVDYQGLEAIQNKIQTMRK